MFEAEDDLATTIVNGMEARSVQKDYTLERILSLISPDNLVAL